MPRTTSDQSPRRSSSPRIPSGFPVHGRLYIRLVANVTNAIIQSSNANNVSPAIPVRFITRPCRSLRVTRARRCLRPCSPATRSRRPSGSPTRARPTRPSSGHRGGAGGLGLPRTSTWAARSSRSTPCPRRSRPGRAPRLRGRAQASATSSARDLRADHDTPGERGDVHRRGGDAADEPGPYFLGVVIDPNNKLPQLSLPTNRLEQIRVVGPRRSPACPRRASSARR